MGLQSSYFIAGNYFCIMWESWIGGKKKSLSIRQREKEDTKKGWQNRKKHNLCIGLWMRRMSVYPIRSLIVVFDFLEVITRKVLFLLRQSENKHSNKCSRSHTTVATPVELSYQGRVAPALFETSAPRFQTNARFSLAFISWRDGTDAGRCYPPTFFSIFSSCADFKKKKKQQSWERGRGLRCDGPEGQSLTPFYEAQKGNVVFWWNAAVFWPSRPPYLNNHLIGMTVCWNTWALLISAVLLDYGFCLDTVNLIMLDQCFITVTIMIYPWLDNEDTLSTAKFLSAVNNVDL